jgi:hypothetical protein
MNREKSRTVGLCGEGERKRTRNGNDAWAKLRRSPTQADQAIPYQQQVVLAKTPAGQKSDAGNSLAELTPVIEAMVPMMRPAREWLGSGVTKGFELL